MKYMNSFEDPDSKSARLTKLAKARAEDKSTTFALALSEIGREFPVLAQEAREEVLGRKITVEKFDERTIAIGSNPSQQLSDMSRALASEKGISYRAALLEVSRQCRELCHASREQSLKDRF